ncbi:Nif3-like dinuclear metal center hexameric protein [Paenibacillus montanisoli]|uniref:GTP cyclohydrolase 1 type 2 homolog n=1 Tax=Paenibacillus montanisoli TaxID=2081970 RepID=A0A328UBM6_9BACL|nr:Nif3-like dinuclear metal center hexameric protein [Paenibacillus montanisoli]RAP77446.1 transcriptional regulator [Paenibacillus montanisoli]
MAVRIQDVIDIFEERSGASPNGADRLLFGDAGASVTGIAVTFMATRQVLEQAHEIGANMIISHEGLFYSHHHAMPLPEDGPVYNAKLEAITGHNLAVYRYHDGLHRGGLDGIMEGLIQALGWEDCVTEHEPAASVVSLPPCTVGELAEHVKRQLGLGMLRAAGEPTMTCRRVGLLVGYRGGGNLAIPLFERHRLDAMLYGEGPEWETPEYVRDAVYAGQAKSLLVLGHAESEQPGMKLLADRLGRRFPGVPVQFIPVAPVFTVL